MKLFPLTKFEKHAFMFCRAPFPLNFSNVMLEDILKGSHIRDSTCYLHDVSCSSSCMIMISCARDVLQCAVSVQGLVCIWGVGSVRINGAFGALNPSRLRYVQGVVSVHVDVAFGTKFRPR